MLANVKNIPSNHLLALLTPVCQSLGLHSTMSLCRSSQTPDSSYSYTWAMSALNNRRYGLFDLGTKGQWLNSTFQKPPTPKTLTPNTKNRFLHLTISGIERRLQWEESWVATRWQTRPVTLITRTVQLQIEPTSWAAMTATAASTQTNYSNVYLVLINFPKSWYAFFNIILRSFLMLYNIRLVFQSLG